MKTYQQTLLALLMTTASLAGCTTKSASNAGSQMLQSDANAATDTLSTSNIVYHKVQDSTITCTLRVDYPTGTDSLAVGLRRYVNKTLAEIELSAAYISDQPTTPPPYSGDLSKAQTVVDHYGKTCYDRLVAVYKDLTSNNQLDRIVLSYDARLSKTDETAGYITYTATVYTYLDGAHGSTLKQVENISKQTGKVVNHTVDSLQLKALQPLMRKGVLSYLNSNMDKDEQVADKDLGSYLFIDNGIIPLPSLAPVLTRNGLHFVYQQYEIGPYALGIVEFTVPYQDIKPMMTAEARSLIDER